MRALDSLDIEELFERKEKSKKSLEKILNRLIKFVNNTSGTFFDLKNEEKLAKLEGNYTQRRNRIYKLNECLPVKYRTDISIYDKIYEVLAEKIEHKNSEYMIKQCEAIKRERGFIKSKMRVSVREVHDPRDYGFKHFI